MESLEKDLQKIGLSSKEARIYLTLLELGPTAIRKIAEKTGINRGTTYESLKKLQKIGLVSYFHQGKKQHFVSEEPRVLNNLLNHRKDELKKAEDHLSGIISSLSSISKQSKNQPIIKFYENFSGIRTILEDVLDSVKKLPKKEYVAYSSSSIRPYLYNEEALPNFTEERIKRKIHVRTIAIGSGGGLHGIDERKWLTKKDGAPIYTLIYGNKVAMISVGQNKTPHGLIIEDEAINKTEKLIFDSLWKSL